MKKKNGKNQVASAKAENFKNMKEVERGKMRKTIQNIKGTPAEFAADKKRAASKTVKVSKPKRKPKVPTSTATAAVPAALGINALLKKKSTGKMSASEARKLDAQTADEVGAKRMKPVKKPDLSFRPDEGSPAGTESKKSTTTYTPRKKYEGDIDTYDTPFGKIKADSSDDAFNFDVEEKDGGYLKKDMMMKKRKKGGVVKRRMGGKVGGYGKALRGY